MRCGHRSKFVIVVGDQMPAISPDHSEASAPTARWPITTKLQPESKPEEPDESEKPEGELDEPEDEAKEFKEPDPDEPEPEPEPEPTPVASAITELKSNPESEPEPDTCSEAVMQTQLLRNRLANRKAVDVPALLAAARAASRTTLVQLHNTTSYSLTLEPSRTTVTGAWTVSPPLMVLPVERDVAFGSESRGFFTGTAASIVYTLSHPRYGGLEVTLQWENPFMGSSAVSASVTKGGPLRVTKKMSVGHNNQAIFTVTTIEDRGPVLATEF
eukprot:SAG11_NODE_6509_length_1300_cov_1.248959_1_plen_272_part_00